MFKRIFQKPLIKSSNDNIVLEKISYDTYNILDKSKKNKIGRVSLKQLDGCCGVALMYNLHIYDDFKSLGFGKKAVEIIIKYAKQADYSTLICTDVANNTPMIKLLKDLNFNHVYNFTNTKTGNSVNLSVLDLNDTGTTDKVIKVEIDEILLEKSLKHQMFLKVKNLNFFKKIIFKIFFNNFLK